MPGSHRPFPLALRIGRVAAGRETWSFRKSVRPFNLSAGIVPHRRLVRTFLQGLTLPAPSVWTIYGNGAETPDKVDFEMHPCCH
jgi:hypothetical protein